MSLLSNIGQVSIAHSKLLQEGAQAASTQARFGKVTPHAVWSPLHCLYAALRKMHNRGLPGTLALQQSVKTWGGAHAGMITPPCRQQSAHKHATQGHPA